MRALIAAALILPLAACATGFAPAPMGAAPLDDTFHASGQYSNDGTRIVHFHKILDRPGGRALCIATAFEVGNGFYADELEERLMGKTWAEVEGRAALGTLLHVVRPLRGPDIRRPETAECFALPEGSAGAEAARLRMPGALSLDERPRKVHFIFHRLPEGTAADWPKQEGPKREGAPNG